MKDERLDIEFQKSQYMKCSVSELKYFHSLNVRFIRESLNILEINVARVGNKAIKELLEEAKNNQFKL
jgi:DNA-directed RNA polymerase specialized sigma subunit